MCLFFRLFLHRTSSLWLKQGCLIPHLQLYVGNCLPLDGVCYQSNQYQPFKVIFTSLFTHVTIWSLLWFLPVLTALFVFPQMDRKAPGKQDGSIPNPDVCSKDWAQMIIPKTCVLTVPIRQMVCPDSRYVTGYIISLSDKMDYSYSEPKWHMAHWEEWQLVAVIVVKTINRQHRLRAKNPPHTVMSA